jgi:manganese/zinc/iron transport system permease protein
MIPLHTLALSANDAWTIATAATCAVACGVLGCFLVLRRLSLLGDAISHAILPGLAMAFILSASRDVIPMLVGATVVGLLTAGLSAAIHRWGKIPEDAAMGVVFTSLFAIGVIMMAWMPRSLDLDPGCVLYGVLESTSLDTVKFIGLELPRAFISLFVVLLIVLAFVTFGYKELKLTSFDPALAASLGYSVAFIHYTFMSLVAATTVVSFEAVGSILVIVMLIAPAATAHLLTDRLNRMIILAGVLAISSSVIGYLLAVLFDTSASGMISVVSGLQFGIAVFAAPRHGVISKALNRAALSIRIAREDILGMLYRWNEQHELDPAAQPISASNVVEALRRPILARLAMKRLAGEGLLVRDSVGVHLTPEGLTRARGIVRSHRLWETFLASHLGLPLDHLHEPSHRVEHFITREMQTELTTLAPDTDPHGKNIPGNPS